jgi:NitT/TauT family transport system substrate-binding protein
MFALALPLLSIAAGASAQSNVPIEKMKLKMAVVPAFHHAGLFAAIERGYFAQRGLDVELVISRGADTTYQVAGGTIELAASAPDAGFFNAIERGLPVTLVGSLALNSADKSTTPLMLRKDLADSGKVKSVADLNGMKVANLAPGGVTEYLTALALKTGNLGLKDVDYISPMAFGQMTDALKTKSVDAALLPEPFATLAEQNGSAIRLSTKHDLNEQVLMIQTNKEWAEKHPNVIVNFLIGYLMGSRDFAGDKFLQPENIALLEKYTKVSADVIKAANMPLIPVDGHFNEESIMAQQRFHMANGKLTYKEPIPLNKFVDQSYLKKALEVVGPYKP